MYILQQFKTPLDLNGEATGDAQWIIVAKASSVSDIDYIKTSMLSYEDIANLKISILINNELIDL